MVTTLDYGQRVARKAYRCDLCNAVVHPGERYSFQTNVFDDHIYTWRDCLACRRDGVIGYVNDWDGGWSDEGVDYEKAYEWAEQAVEWPKRWSQRHPWQPITTTERMAARNWVARAAGDE